MEQVQVKSEPEIKIEVDLTVFSADGEQVKNEDPCDDSYEGTSTFTHPNFTPAEPEEQNVFIGFNPEADFMPENEEDSSKDPLSINHEDLDNIRKVVGDYDAPLSEFKFHPNLNSDKLDPNPNPSQEENVIFTCQLCRTKFRWECELLAHIQVPHRLEFLCSNDHCGRSFSSEHSLSCHEAECDVRFLCPLPLCTVTFKNENNLKTHLREIHGQALPSGMKVQKLRLLNLSPGSIRRKSPPRLAFGLAPQYRCSTCLKCFPDIDRFRTHLKQHSTGKSQSLPKEIERTYKVHNIQRPILKASGTRGRGRPQKQIKPVQNYPNVNLIGKRGRGRPRKNLKTAHTLRKNARYSMRYNKNPSLMEGESGPVVKRGVGRPKGSLSKRKTYEAAIEESDTDLHSNHDHCANNMKESEPAKTRDD